MRTNTGSTVRYVVGETDTDFCQQQIKAESFIFLVDLARLGKSPGTVSEIPLGDVGTGMGLPLTVHDACLLTSVMTGCKGCEGIFIGIEPYEIDYCCGLSPVLQEQFPGIIDNVGKIIKLNMPP